MALRDLQACEGADDPASGSPVHLLRVLLFNLVCALEQGHIAPASVEAVFRDLLGSATLSGGSPPDVHIDQVYLELAAILTRRAPDLFFERSDAVTSFVGERPITYQPSWAFRYWLDLGEARKPVHSAADVAVLIEEFKVPSRRIAGAVIGAPSDVVWLTPDAGEVKNNLQSAWREQRTGRHGDLDRRGFADFLRNLLGLHRRVFPERAVALVLEDSLAEMIDRAEAAAGTAKRRAIAAPTQFDAKDYPRFRHWPTADVDPDQDLGRSWRLDDPAPGAGAPEIVAEPIGLDRVRRIISLGPIRNHRLSDQEAIGADRTFADSVCGSVTLADLFADLGDRLAL